MDVDNTELNNLCRVFLDLNDEDKGKVIRLAEGLLNSQNVITDGNMKLKDKTENGKLNEREEF